MSMQNDSEHPPASARVDSAGAVHVGANEGAHRSLASDERSQLSRALVHELRNALAPIRNGVHLLRFRAREDPSLVQVTDIIDRQVNEMVRLLNSPGEAASAGPGELKSAEDIPAAQSQVIENKE